MKCWICETEMKFKKIIKLKIVTKKEFSEYRCAKCGEVVYDPSEMIIDLTAEEYKKKGVKNV